MSSIKMTPPTFDTKLYRSGPRGANKAVKNFMFKLRGWAQATTISSKIGQGGETSLAWTCITNAALRHAHVSYPPASGHGANAKSKMLNRSAQAQTHYALMNSGLLEILPAEFQLYDMDAYDNVDRAIDGEPCPVGTNIVECLEKLGVMTAYDIEARFDAFRDDLKGFKPLEKKTHHEFLRIEDWFNNAKVEVQELKALDAYATQQPTLLSGIHNALHRLDTDPAKLVNFDKFLNDNERNEDLESYLRNLQAYIAGKYNKFKIAQGVEQHANYTQDKVQAKGKSSTFTGVPCDFCGEHAKHELKECRRMKEALQALKMKQLHDRASRDKKPRYQPYSKGPGNSYGQGKGRGNTGDQRSGHNRSNGADKHNGHRHDNHRNGQRGGSGPDRRNGGNADNRGSGNTGNRGGNRNSGNYNRNNGGQNPRYKGNNYDPNYQSKRQGAASSNIVLLDSAGNLPNSVTFASDTAEEMQALAVMVIDPTIHPKVTTDGCPACNTPVTTHTGNGGTTYHVYQCNHGDGLLNCPDLRNSLQLQRDDPDGRWVYKDDTQHLKSYPEDIKYIPALDLKSDTGTPKVTNDTIMTDDESLCSCPSLVNSSTDASSIGNVNDGNVDDYGNADDYIAYCAPDSNGMLGGGQCVFIK